MRLKDRVTIVTGGAGGLGRAFALKLAQEGAKIALADLISSEPVKEEIESLGGEAISILTDITDESSTREMAAQTWEQFGRIDCLVNNAAIYAGLKRKSFMEIDLGEWDRVMNVNIKGAFLAIRSVFPYMQKLEYGKIVNLASEVFFTGSHGFAHYVSSKGGIVGLTRALAIELGPHNICINCIAPGFTDTEASRGLADVNKYDTSKTPIQRLGQPDDLTGSAVFLCSKESDFMTGQIMLIDGGRAMH